MAIAYDPNKREATLRARGMDFERAAEVLDGDVLGWPDERFDYGELRIVTLRLDADVLDTFRSGGPGWQSRINAALRKALEG